MHCRERAWRAGIQSEGGAGRAAGAGPPRRRCRTVLDGGGGSWVVGAVSGEARLGRCSYAMTRWRSAQGARPAGNQMQRLCSSEHVVRALSLFPVAFNGATVKTNGVAGFAAALSGAAGLVFGPVRGRGCRRRTCRRCGSLLWRSGSLWRRGSAHSSSITCATPTDEERKGSDY